MQEPHVSEQLVDWLFAIYGPELERATSTEDFVSAKAKLSVVRKIEALYLKQCAQDRQPSASSSLTGSNQQNRPEPLPRPLPLRRTR